MLIPVVPAWEFQDFSGSAVWSASAPGTFTNVTTHIYVWAQVGNLVLIHVKATGDVGGGTPRNSVNVTLPVPCVTPSATPDFIVGAGRGAAAGGSDINDTLYIKIDATNGCRIMRENDVNWSSGATRHLQFMGFYRAG